VIARHADRRAPGLPLAIALVAALLWGPIERADASTAQAPAGPPGRALLAADRADAIRTAYRSPSRVEERHFHSAVLDRSMPYFVYLPPGYDADDRRYPVLYMLHGLGGTNTEWRRYGLLDAADELIKGGAIPPMLIVLPQGDQSYWVDHARGKRWGHYTAMEVVAEVDRSLRTVPDRRARAIGGNSMGGHGALQLALRYPDVFGVVGAHVPTIRSWADGVDYFPPEFYGDERYYADHDPVSLLAAHPEAARRLTISIDVGEADPTWRQVVTALHEQLDALGVPHEFRLVAGTHNDEYWVRHRAEYLRFYARALRGPASAGGRGTSPSPLDRA
jgi:S-formylglutathione hydrolase FrmB